MPNFCDYGIKVIGTETACKEFVKIIQADYDYNKMEFSHTPHMFRVFDALICDEKYKNGYGYVEIGGDCAWSVLACMMPGAFTYYGDAVEAKYKYGTHLLEISRKLNLKIEVFSTEPGMGFQEHYMILYGNLAIDQCQDYDEYWFDETIEGSCTFEEQCEDYGLVYETVSSSYNPMVDDGPYRPNMVPWDYEIDELRPMANIILADLID